MLRSMTAAGVLALSTLAAADPVSTSSRPTAAIALDTDQRRPHGPPPEAIAACKDQSEGSACTVSLHGQSIDGTCRKGPDGDGPLACAPSHPPAPPAEAIEACINKAAGNACTVQFDDRTVDGTCRSLPNESDLVCMPEAPPS
jgi:hypothetical protein